MAQPENYMPWEQIEPLIQPGMTAAQVNTAVLTSLGLSSAYTLICDAVEDSSALAHLRRGAFVIKVVDADAEGYEYLPNEVIA